MASGDRTPQPESGSNPLDASRSSRKYPYDRLPDRHIRLLTLIPGDVDKGLQASLKTVSFKRIESLEESSKRPNYEALSYFWGKRPEEGIKYSISMIKDDTAYEMDIRENLESALRRLRYKDKERYLWVDALCIDQSVDSDLNENNEKNVQIPLMDIIYNRAQDVCIWLGCADSTSDGAMDFVSKVLNLDIFDVFRKDSGAAQTLADFGELLSRPWFGRRWIVQELAVARSATIYCGTRSVSWTNFAGAVSLFSSKHIQLKEIFRRSDVHKNDPDYLGDVRQLGAFKLVHAASNFFQKSDDGDILDKLVTLEEVISLLTTFDAKDPRDIIYAVLSLASDATASNKDKLAFTINPEKLDSIYDKAKADAVARDAANSRPASPIAPRSPVAHRAAEADNIDDASQKSVRRVSSDWRIRNAFSQGAQALLGPLQADKIITIKYKSSVFDVYRMFIEHTVSRSKSIDILCRPWAVDPVDGPGLPSWIPRRSKAIYGYRQERAFSRIRADLLVGSASTEGKHYYSASKNSKTEFLYRDHEVLDRSVVVRGFVLDTIKTIFFPAMGGIIPSEWYDVWKQNSNSIHDSAFWRTLVADRGLEGQKPPPSYYGLACQHAFERRVDQGQGYLDTREMMKECPSIVEEFLQRVQAVTWMRRLVVLKKDKRLGLVPYDAKKKDLICILQGCSVPIVLRRHETNSWVHKRLDLLPPEHGPPEINFVGPDATQQIPLATGRNEAFGGEGHGNYSDPSHISTATEKAAAGIAARNKLATLRKDLNAALVEIGLRRIALAPDPRQPSRSRAGTFVKLEHAPTGKSNVDHRQSELFSSKPDLTNNGDHGQVDVQARSGDPNFKLTHGQTKATNQHPNSGYHQHPESVPQQPSIEEAADEDARSFPAKSYADAGASSFAINVDGVDPPPSQHPVPSHLKQVNANAYETLSEPPGISRRAVTNDRIVNGSLAVPSADPHNKASPSSGQQASGDHYTNGDEHEPDVRPLQKQPSWKQQTIPRYFYEFIGECYIHGMMDGEATKIPRAAFPTEEAFDPRQGDPQVFWLSQESAELRKMGF